MNDYERWFGDSERPSPQDWVRIVATVYVSGMFGLGLAEIITAILR